MSRHLLRLIALGSGLALSGVAFAAPLNILWYTGGVNAHGVPGDYQAAINVLAASAPSAPGGNTWTVTFWDSGAMPTGTFNALVIASPEGGWGAYPDYGSLSGLPAFGDRLMLTGQDADWHYQNSPGSASFDGPKGFLLDSINWAGSGTGMGLVALGVDGTGAGECGGPVLSLTGYSSDCTSTDNVQIPPGYASFPINTNLSSTGLSKWGESAHVGFFNIDPMQWTGINVNGDDSCGGAPGTCYVTIVSAATGSGGIGSSVPEPADLGMFGLGLVLMGLFAGLRRRRDSV
jgi:hypothetical protein